MRNNKVYFEWHTFEASFEKKEVHSFTDYIYKQTTLYDLGSKDTYFLVTSEHRLPIDTLLTIWKKMLSGSFLLIEIKIDLLPFFYIVISRSWLGAQLQVEEVRLQKSIDTILTEWQKSLTEVAMGYFLFQKNVNQSNHRLILCQTYFFELLYLFLNSLELELRGDSIVKFRDKELKRIMEVEDQITQNLSANSPTVEQMSLMAGMNISKFKVLFKEIYGLSPHQYIIEKKIAFAKELLQTGEYTLTQIAYKLGYNHTSGFTRIYKKKLYESSSNKTLTN